MDNILAIDCSRDLCSVALQVEGRLIERSIEQARQHNRLLLPMIQEVLLEAELELKAIHGFAFGAGPGSFTGLRLAASVVQGLAFSLNRPAIPVSNLQAAALSYHEQQGIASEEPALIVLVAEDARRDSVYWGAYAVSERVTVLEADQLLPIEQLEQKQQLYSGAHCVGEIWPSPQRVFPLARSVLKLATFILAEGGSMRSARDARPVYLREQVDWKKWQPKQEQMSR